MMLALTRDVKDKVPQKLAGLGINDLDLPPVDVNKEEHERFILPLKCFRLIEGELENEIRIPITKEVEPKFTKYKRVTLSLTDDPETTWASDWSHLGCFRLVYKYFQATVEVKGNVLIVRNKRKKNNPMRDRDLTVPDRRYKKVVFK